MSNSVGNRRAIIGTGFTGMIEAARTIAGAANNVAMPVKKRRRGSSINSASLCRISELA